MTTVTITINLFICKMGEQQGHVSCRLLRILHVLLAYSEQDFNLHFPLPPNNHDISA